MENTIETTAVLQLFGNRPMNIANKFLTAFVKIEFMLLVVVALCKKL